MKFFVICFLYVSTVAGFAQNFIPIDTADSEKRTAFLKHYNTSNAVYTKQLARNYRGKVGRELSKSYEEFYQQFAKEIERGTFVFDKRFTDFTTEILDEILQKNPTVSKDVNLLISRDVTANAYCLADGTMVVHLGLFYLLDNEDQLASIIAHELSHKILNHSIEMNRKKIEEESSADAKKRVQTLKKTKYNQSGKALALFREQMYEEGKNRRKNEMEADSLAFVLLKNTDFDKTEYVKSLQLMQLYDSIRPMGLQDSIYRKVFDLPGQPFKESWFDVEDFSQYKYEHFKEKLNLDSIATHPETQERIDQLKNNLPPKEEIIAKSASEEFLELSKLAGYERVPSLYITEAYGHAVYLSLLHLQLQTDDEYYSKWLGNSFQKIYEARKAYTLNRYLERVNPKNQSSSYQRFLGFMWNLSLNEIKAIADYYST